MSAVQNQVCSRREESGKVHVESLTAHGFERDLEKCHCCLSCLFVLSLLFFSHEKKKKKKRRCDSAEPDDQQHIPFTSLFSLSSKSCVLTNDPWTSMTKHRSDEHYAIKQADDEDVPLTILNWRKNSSDWFDPWNFIRIIQRETQKRRREKTSLSLYRNQCRNKEKNRSATRKCEKRKRFNEEQSSSSIVIGVMHCKRVG